jgi:hypothetical protein
MAPSLAPLPPFQAGHAPQNEGETIHRDHSQVSFEWQILGVEWLKHSLEKIQISEWTVDYEVENPEVLPELLRRGIIIGDGLYRLELGEPAHLPIRCEPKSYSCRALQLVLFHRRTHPIPRSR